MIVIPGTIPIRIHPFFWMLIAILGWVNSETVYGTALWAFVITFSVLIHEFGHALTAKAFGQEAEIDLVGFGGVTRRSGPQIKSWQEFLIVLNGPMAGFLLYFIASFVLSQIHSNSFSTLQYILNIAVYVNLFWTILNLVPVLPLDGGHLLRIILEGVLGVRGTRISLLISMVLAALCSLFFFLNQSFLVGSLFLMMAFETYRGWADYQVLTEKDSDQNLQAVLKEAVELMHQGNQHEALSKLLFLREQTKDGILFLTATQYIARILTEQGHLQQAYDWLSPLQNKLSPDYLILLQHIAYRLERWEEAIQIGTEAYRQSPSVEAAITNAYSYAILGKERPAIGWLQSAKQMGLPHLVQLVSQREFDAIRDKAEFQSFLRSLR